MIKYGLVKKIVMFLLVLCSAFVLNACDFGDETEDMVEPIIQDSIEATSINTGDHLEESTLDATFEHPLTGEKISGSLEWVNPTITLEEDTEVRWRFIPDEAGLLEIQGTVLVNVTNDFVDDDLNGDDLNGDDENGNDENGNDENGYDDRIYPLIEEEIEVDHIVLGETLFSVSLSGVFIDPADQTLIKGILEWELPTQSPNKPTEFQWRFIPENTDKYYEITGTILVSIDPMIDSLTLESSYIEGGITFEVYDVDMDGETEYPLRDMLIQRGYEPFEPSSGIETYIAQLTDTLFSGNYYKSDTTYLYVYQPSDTYSQAVTVEIPIETLMQRLEPEEDRLPDEDGDGQDFELIPRYAGSVLLKDRLWLSSMQGIEYPWEGGRLDYGIYADDASPQDIYNFYKTFFTEDEAWIIKQDESLDNGHYELVAEHDTMQVGMRTYDSYYAYNADIVGYSIYKQTWLNQTNTLPENDVIEDPAILSLYPGSVALYGNESMVFMNRDYMNHYQVKYPTNSQEIIYGVEATTSDVFNHFLQEFTTNDDWIWLHSNAYNCDNSDFIFSSYQRLRAYKDNHFVEIIVFEHSEYDNAVSYAIMIQTLPTLPENDRYDVDDLNNVPRHPDSVIVEHKAIEDDFASSHEYFYATEAPLHDVYEFYINNLSDAWEITRNDIETDYHGHSKVYFVIEAENDNQMLGIKGEYGREFKDSTSIYIIRADKGKPLPDHDLEGEDFEKVNRYPGSIIFYEFDELDIHKVLGYSVEATLDDVYTYYLTNHFDETWTLIYENYIPKENSTFTIHYRKDQLNVEIKGNADSHYFNAVNYNVEVYYGGDGTLPEDDVMGEDFAIIDRYPDSVILLAESEMLVYGTLDTLDDVRTFYENYLAAEGWTIIETNIDENSFDISAMQGFDTVVMVQATTVSDYDDAVEITIVLVE